MKTIKYFEGWLNEDTANIGNKGKNVLIVGTHGDTGSFPDDYLFMMTDAHDEMTAKDAATNALIEDGRDEDDLDGCKVVLFIPDTEECITIDL
jgi:hypothetical protein